MFQIAIVEDAVEELRRVPAFYRQLIATAIEEQLPHEPAGTTKHRKCLPSLVPGFAYDPPIWELRVQDWRVFYDVDDDRRMVTIRAVREKPKGKTTGEIV